MKNPSQKRLLTLSHKGLILAPLVLAWTTSTAHSALHLAFGVDTDSGSTNFDRIMVRDLHGDHYHTFSQNNGDPGSHIPAPFTLVPGGSTATFNLAAMDISPFSQSRYTTALSPAGDFHLELTALLGPGSENLTVLFWHGDHTHTMAVGGSAEHLELDEILDIELRLPAEAELGSYTAEFRIVDESGNYTDSPTFSINANAIPEPSSLLLTLLGATALLRRKR
ncbi:PEP-CTERM sorting domain-containing protein [Roseibacillus ishigakijimensis]|uniref:PEP-CTERM sorting domain-containing protein n=1 Tax=Roseibacillus ishigakijimensis TaxID=454146 RepID=A0A934VIT6_9BACT|nr:PEP-CTERM sorting domain-containing protein [Roseibacillus ishigakijimensis]MBK1835413.1 PEP-CTERM sorting domain-containing protein [Roseibacillus ishigakijimensis]